MQSVDEALKLMPRGVENIIYKPFARPVQMIAKNGVLLRMMQGEEYGKIYRLNDLLHNGCRLITVGRDDSDVQNDIPIVEKQSSYISRKHCTLEMDETTRQWYIRDGQWTGKNVRGHNWIRSMNGTFVNSSEVTFNGMPISAGDIISIGDVKLRVEGY